MVTKYSIGRADYLQEIEEAQRQQRPRIEKAAIAAMARAERFKNNPSFEDKAAILNALIDLSSASFVLSREVRLKLGFEPRMQLPKFSSDTERLSFFLEKYDQVYRELCLYFAPHQQEKEKAECKQRSSDPWGARLVIVKVVACLLLLLSFADMPYGFYQLLRWVVCATAITVLWENAKSLRSEGWKTVCLFFFGITAILFNPILPIRLDRDTWEVLDLIAIVGIGLSFIGSKPSPTP